MTLALVGDIGGTNARFAIADLAPPRPVLTDVRGMLGRDFLRPIDAVESYLAGVGARPVLAVLAVAGPVEAGAVRLTNTGGDLSEAELERRGFARARLINDFAAQAWAAPLLDAPDYRSVGGPAVGAADASLAVLGAGTGFGLAGWIRDENGREAVLAGEGGHVGFSPGDELEMAVMQRLARLYGRCSVERILSGPGLLDLHGVLAELQGRSSDLDDPAQVTRAALLGEPTCAATLARFCGILGSVAGDAALAFGARGGVYIAGGIAPTILGFLERSTFRTRFEAKGRFVDYLRDIPTRVVTREHPALLGAANAARRLQD